jgi:hypothetical protein
MTFRRRGRRVSGFRYAPRRGEGRKAAIRATAGHRMDMDDTKTVRETLDPFGLRP